MANGMRRPPEFFEALRAAFIDPVVGRFRLPSELPQTTLPNTRPPITFQPPQTTAAGLPRRRPSTTSRVTQSPVTAALPRAPVRIATELPTATENVFNIPGVTRLERAGQPPEFFGRNVAAPAGGLSIVPNAGALFGTGSVVAGTDIFSRLSQAREAAAARGDIAGALRSFLSPAEQRQEKLQGQLQGLLGNLLAPGQRLPVQALSALLETARVAATPSGGLDPGSLQGLKILQDLQLNPERVSAQKRQAEIAAERLRLDRAKAEASEARAERLTPFQIETLALERARKDPLGQPLPGEIALNRAILQADQQGQKVSISEAVLRELAAQSGQDFDAALQFFRERGVAIAP